MAAIGDVLLGWSYLKMAIQGHRKEIGAKFGEADKRPASRAGETSKGYRVRTATSQPGSTRSPLSETP
jgi:hypothetical protein